MHNVLHIHIKKLTVCKNQRSQILISVMFTDGYIYVSVLYSEDYVVQRGKYERFGKTTLHLYWKRLLHVL